MKHIFKRKERIHEVESDSSPSLSNEKEEPDFTSSMAKDRLRRVCSSGRSERLCNDEGTFLKEHTPSPTSEYDDDSPYLEPQFREYRNDNIVAIDEEEHVASKSNRIESKNGEQMSSADNSDAPSAPCSDHSTYIDPLMDRRFPNPNLVVQAEQRRKRERQEKKVSFVDSIIEDRRNRSSSSAMYTFTKENHFMAQTKTKTADDNVTHLLETNEFNDSNTTVVSEGTRTTGNTDANHRNMVVLGSYEGNLRCKKLIIGECGSVKGDIDAESIDILGALSGDVSANEITLRSSGLLEGEFVALSFATEHGCRFEAKGKARPEDEFREEASDTEARRYPRVGMPGATARSQRRGGREDGGH